MNNKEILGALALDLRRVAQGLHRGSYAMAERFSEEALKRKEEIDTKNVKSYVVKLANDMEKVIRGPMTERKAEDILMYSVLFQNAALSIND